MSSPVHIIAEAGTNHGGCLETAKQLVDVAARARADSVKFQIIYPEGLYLPQIWTNGHCEPNQVFQQRAAGMLRDDDYRTLAEYARQCGIPLSASIFDRRGLDLLDELDPPYFKIASCDLNNTRLLKQTAERGRTMVVSTGMATLGEIERAVEAIVSTGHTDLVLMHCVSVYPCPLEKMNLHFLDVLREAFGFPIGLSDHTESSLAAAMAVAKGVTWIEKHFTLDRSAEGFDHHYALEPDALAAFVQDVRASWQACQPAATKIGAEEKNVQQRARRGVYAARDLQPNEVIREEDLLVVRPAGPIGPDELDGIIGRPVRVPIRRYQPLSLANLEIG